MVQENELPPDWKTASDPVAASYAAAPARVAAGSAWSCRETLPDASILWRIAWCSI